MLDLSSRDALVEKLRGLELVINDEQGFLDLVLGVCQELLKETYPIKNPDQMYQSKPGKYLVAPNEVKVPFILVSYSAQLFCNGKSFYRASRISAAPDHFVVVFPSTIDPLGIARRNLFGLNLKIDIGRLIDQVAFNRGA